MRRLMQGSALLLAGALLACAGTPEPGTDGRPAWVDDPPARCAVGHSGPTLNPGHAIRQSRLNALESLAAAQLGTRIESDLLIDGEGVVAQFTEEHILGVLRDAQIVAMAADARGASAAARGALRSPAMFALACRGARAPAGLPAPDHPEWLLRVPDHGGRLCVHAIGGPTRRPEDQREAALRDGRAALAAALESAVERRVVDDGRNLARVFSNTKSTEWAIERASSVDTLEFEWLDESGRGPLGLRGVLYGVVCSPP